MPTKTTLSEPHRDHVVQFYQDEHALLATVSRFTRDGLKAGQPVVVIATEAHRDGLTRRLLADGLAPDTFERNGALWLVDARETLDAFMVDGMPDPPRFKHVVGGLLTMARARRGGQVRAFGEMVDLLWRDGRAEAAIRLEGLWNALAATHHFSLLCGYAIGTFRDDTPGYDISDVCRTHTRVLPA